MKRFLILISILSSSVSAFGATHCSDGNVDSDLLSKSHRDILIDQLRVGSVVLFDNKAFRIVDFFTSGGPEQGITIAPLSGGGTNVNIYCKDENKPGED